MCYFGCAGERVVETSRFEFHQGDWLWKLVLHSPAHLHVHPIAFLPIAWSHTRPALRSTHWHVEFRFVHLFFFQLLLLIVFVLFWRFSASWVIHFLFCYRGDRSVTDGRSNRSRILSRYLKKFQMKSTEPVAGRSEKIEKKTRKFLHFFYYYCCFFFVYYLSFSHFLALSM